MLGAEFAMLAISTFLLTTLDTCTRLTRFLIEELFSWRSQKSRYAGTFFALLFPALLVIQTFPGPNGELQPAWKAVWPLFGATNQLLAALALLTFVVFLKFKKTSFTFALLPALMMMFMPMLALWYMIVKFGVSSLMGGASVGMFVLGMFLMFLSFKKLFADPKLSNQSEM